MAGIFNLNNGTNLSDLYKDLDESKLEKIKSAAAGGFTEEELNALKEAGIDITLIKNNSTLSADTITKKGQKTDADVQAKAEEIRQKYNSNPAAFSGDKYSGSNPEVQALNGMLDDYALANLAKEGFSKSQILQIVSIAFPTVGISPIGEDGEYTRPYGHGADAQQIFQRFSSQLVASTGEDSEEIQAAKAKLSMINNQISSNNQNMQVLQATIVQLQKEVERQIDEAIEDSEDIQEEHKAKAQQVVNKRLNEYTNSDGEMDYKTFQRNISNDLGGLQTSTNRALGDVVNSLLDASYKMNLLNGYVSELGDLSKSNQELTEEAASVKTDLDEMVKEQMENAGAEDEQAKCTDPIGFSSAEARFDFFVDKDSNQDITNENEFLGAKDGFAEMTALDTDGDGLVTSKELSAGNVKVVKTMADGSQSIVDVSEVFTSETDGINLNSYKATNQDIGNGNTLLGTFSATMNGQDMKGYQTLDSNEWLDANYEFTDEVDGVGRFSQDKTDVVEALDYSEQVNIFTVTNQELQSKLDSALSAFGITESMVDSLTNTMDAEARRDGLAIKNEFETKAAKEKEIAQQDEAQKKRDAEEIRKILAAEAEEELEEEEALDEEQAGEDALDGTEPTTEPTTDSTTDPTADPTTDPTADPTSDPTSEPSDGVASDIEVDAPSTEVPEQTNPTVDPTDLLEIRS